MPQDCQVRNGDCAGNDIWSLHKDKVILTECALLCSSSTPGQYFMFYNNHRCYPKTKTCGITSKTNPLNVFYDKVPTGYAMRTGISLGNDVRQLYRSRVTSNDCAQHWDSSSACTAFMHYDTWKSFINLRNTLSILHERRYLTVMLRGPVIAREMISGMWTSMNP